MSLTNDEHGAATADATADAGGEGAPDSSLPPSGPRWYEADFEAFPDDKVPKDVQECFLNRNLRCEGGTATAYSRCMALAIGMDCEQVHTFTLADLARSRFVKEGATQEMALALLRNIVRFNGGAADRRQGLQNSSLALLVGDNERALKLSAVHPTVDILEAALAALRKKRETTPPIDEGRHAALARTPGYTSAFSPDHLADVLTDALGGTSRKTLGFDDTDRSLYQVKVTSGELTGILDELYRSGAVTRPELAEHHVSPSTVKKLLQLFGHSTDHPARLETHAVLPYTSVRVGPAPGAKISDKAVDAWSAHHHHIAIVCFLHAVEAVGLHKDIPAAQGVHPAPVRGEKFSKGIIFPNLVQALLRVTHEMCAANPALPLHTSARPGLTALCECGALAGPSRSAPSFTRRCRIPWPCTSASMAVLSRPTRRASTSSRRSAAISFSAHLPLPGRRCRMQLGLLARRMTRRRDRSAGSRRLARRRHRPEQSRPGNTPRSAHSNARKLRSACLARLLITRRLPRRLRMPLARNRGMRNPLRGTILPHRFIPIHQ